MSTTTHAYVFYGNVFSRGAIKSKTEVRCCGHLLTLAKFCGECGKPTWVTSEDYVIDQVYQEGDIGYHESFYGSKEVVIGVCLAKISDSNFNDVKAIEILAVDNKIKGRLGSFAKEHSLDMTNARLMLVMSSG